MKYNRELLFGRWFRHDIDRQNRKIVEYAQLTADGCFEFTFITYDHNSNEKIVEEITELGDWGLVADIHFTITKNEIIDKQLYSVDLNDSENYHAYRVLQLDHHVFEYQHIESNEIFVMRKIIDDVGHC